MDMKLLGAEVFLKCQQEGKRMGRTTVEKERAGQSCSDGLGLSSH